MAVKWIPTLAVLLAAQLALAVGLELRSDRLTPAQPDTPLVATDLSSADRLRVDGPVAPDPAASAANAVPQIELVKRDGQWSMPGHDGAPADATKIDALLKRLHALRRGFAIATSAGAAERFAVADHHYVRRVVASSGAKTLATLYLGDSPGLRKSDARSAGDTAVYAVDLATYEVPTDADAWLDSGLLDHDAAGPVEIDVNAAGQPPLVLKRSGTAWQAEGLAADRRLDAARAGALATAIADVKVDSLLGSQAQPQWHQDRPELVLAMKDPQGRTVTWILSRPDKSDKVVLKSSDRPWYLQLEPLNARPLLDAAAPDKLVVAAHGAAAPASAASASGDAASATAAGRHAQR